MNASEIVSRSKSAKNNKQDEYDDDDDDDDELYSGIDVYYVLS